MGFLKICRDVSQMSMMNVLFFQRKLLGVFISEIFKNFGLVVYSVSLNFTFILSFFLSIYLF
jgi:hypothetical protein